MTPLEAYEKSLQDLPRNPPRNVHQITCHKWGLIAGFTKSEIIHAVKAAWGDGRQPTDRELERAHKVGAIDADKPYDEIRITTAKPKRNPDVQDEITRKTFDQLAGDPLSSSELADLSPVDVGKPGDRHTQLNNAVLLLQTLYRPGEFIFCGPQNGSNKNVLPVEEWITRIRTGDTQPQFIMNPLSGGWEAKAGAEKGKTRRGKSCIADHRFTLFEIDTIAGEKVPLQLQSRFLWRRITEGWPIRAIVFSGGKSLHAIVQVDESRETWEANVIDGLFESWKDMGADPKTSNPDRQARLPGHTVPGRRLQSLLWLCPEGWSYERTKKAEHDGGAGKPRSGGQNDPHLKTAEKLAKANQVAAGGDKKAVPQNSAEAVQPIDTPPEPFQDPDGFTSQQRNKLNLMQDIFGGRITSIERTARASA